MKPHILTLRLTSEEATALQVIKRETGIPLQQQVIRAVREWLGKHGVTIK